jgi:hypothetical protein
VSTLVLPADVAMVVCLSHTGWSIMENGSAECHLFMQVVSTIILIDLGNVLVTTD